jgi:hypothetical protein
MQITVQVSDRMRRQAESHGLPVVDFYAMLISRGLESVKSGAAPAPANAWAKAMARAIERLRTSRGVDRIVED